MWIQMDSSGSGEGSVAASFECDHFYVNLSLAEELLASQEEVCCMELVT
jgi:hypothetical protein